MTKKRKRMGNGTPGEPEGARRAIGDSPDGGQGPVGEENDAHNRPRIDDRGSGASPGTPPMAAAGVAGPLAPGQRWSAARKREVVLRLLRGESLEALSRELGVETYRLEEWKSRALSGIDASLRERETCWSPKYLASRIVDLYRGERHPLRPPCSGSSRPWSLLSFLRFAHRPEVVER